MFRYAVVLTSHFGKSDLQTNSGDDITVTSLLVNKKRLKGTLTDRDHIKGIGNSMFLFL